MRQQMTLKILCWQWLLYTTYKFIETGPKIVFYASADFGFIRNLVEL